MTITLPALESELDIYSLLFSGTLVFLALVQVGLGLAFDQMGLACLTLSIELVTALTLGWMSVPWVERDYTLQLTPHQLIINDASYTYGDLVDVDWVCEAPKTTLKIRFRDGRTQSFECLRRGAHGGRGVTRKQRDWVEFTLDGKIQQAAPPESVPAALQELVKERP